MFILHPLRYLLFNCSVKESILIMTGSLSHNIVYLHYSNKLNTSTVKDCLVHTILNYRTDLNISKNHGF